VRDKRSLFIKYENTGTLSRRSAAQHSYAAQAGHNRQTCSSSGVSHCHASKQCVWVWIPEVQPSCCNVAYACGPDAQASQRVPRLELISAHASITPAHTMSAAPFICFCSSCSLPRKGSEAVSVVVGAHGAGRTHTDYFGDCRLVPGLGGSLCGLGCPVVHSLKIVCDNLLSLFCFVLLT